MWLGSAHQTRGARTIACDCRAGRVRPLIVGGCSFDDPTELTFYVKIVNDTSRTVILSNCATGDTLCNGKLYDPEPLKPGGVFPTVQTTVGAPDVELVQSPSGKRLGCLPLIFDYRASGALVRVSEFVPCQKRYPTRSKHPG